MDRGLANNAWLDIFQNMGVRHLLNSFSDHYPLLITLDDISDKKRTKRFRFEAWWIMEESFEEKVSSIWAYAEGNLVSKLEILQRGLENCKTNK